MSTTPTAPDTSPRFEALESILRTKSLRRHASSIRALIPIWLRDEAQVKNLLIESTIRPIVRYFEEAPGLQKPKKGHKDITVKELAMQMQDVQFRTQLSQCMFTVLSALRYTTEELYVLSLEDFRRLEAMLLAVRRELHIEIPSSVRLRTPTEEATMHGLGNDH